jgi:hypothetical protein
MNDKPSERRRAVFYLIGVLSDRTRVLPAATAAAIARTGIKRDQPSFHVAF